MFVKMIAIVRNISPLNLYIVRDSPQKKMPYSIGIATENDTIRLVRVTEPAARSGISAVHRNTKRRSVKNSD